MEDNVYVTTDGAQVRLRPVASYLLAKVQASVESEMRAQKRKLDPPTYKATTVAGEVEVHAHTKDTLETDEDRAEWAEYLAAQEELSRAQIERVSKTLLLRGLAIKSVPDEWLADARYMGIELPSDPRDLMLEYIQAEVLKTPYDLQECIKRILVISMRGTGKENIEQIEALFRNPVEGAAVSESATGEQEQLAV